jgi:hypothetical protein
MHTPRWRKLVERGLIIVCHVSGGNTKQMFLETVHGKVPIFVMST